MSAKRFEPKRWRKSSYSNGGANGACVEVGEAADGSGEVGVRDSKALLQVPRPKDVPTLVFGGRAWAGCLTHLRERG